MYNKWGGGGAVDFATYWRFGLIGLGIRLRVVPVGLGLGIGLGLITTLVRLVRSDHQTFFSSKRGEQ